MNDQKIIDFLQLKLSKVTSELKKTQDAYAELQSRPSPTTEREAFLLEELEKVNLQLECKFLWKLNCGLDTKIDWDNSFALFLP